MLLSKIPGYRFRGERGRHNAASKIAATFLMFKTRRSVPPK